MVDGLAAFCDDPATLDAASATTTAYGSQYAFETAAFDPQAQRCELSMAYRMEGASTPLTFSVGAPSGVTYQTMTIYGVPCSYERSDTAELVECPLADGSALKVTFGFYTDEIYPDARAHRLPESNQAVLMSDLAMLGLGGVANH